MVFSGILFDQSEVDVENDSRGAPEFFVDLNLDQVIASMTGGRDEYNLKPFFHTLLHDIKTIHYRHEVLRDLENQGLFGHIRAFAETMQLMRAQLAHAEKSYYEYQKQSSFLDAVDLYCDAVSKVTHDLSHTDMRSRGMLGFRDYLLGYVESTEFTGLVAETEKRQEELSGVTYALHLQGRRIEVVHNVDAPDYGADVKQTFERFKQAAPKEYKFDSSFGTEMNHVEAAVLDLVAKLFPNVFSALSDYCNRHRGYLDATISKFDRDVQFYIACLEYIGRFKQAGLNFCYPDVSAESKEIRGRDTFDIALANNLVRDKKPVVTNDFYLHDPERIFVVSGPNQGGKTTFARMFGQLHYLASIGCLVPGSESRLFLFDQLFTHFEREENIRNLSGKLEDDLLRIHRILEQATTHSILIMNESFLSTTLNDALFLSKEVTQRIIALGMLCVSVTFLDEIASMSETTVSMVSTVEPRNPAHRTFKVLRRPADGLAYAAALAEKYRLTYSSVAKRIADRKRRMAA